MIKDKKFLQGVLNAINDDNFRDEILNYETDQIIIECDMDNDHLLFHINNSNLSDYLFTRNIPLRQKPDNSFFINYKDIIRNKKIFDASKKIYTEQQLCYTGRKSIQYNFMYIMTLSFAFMLNSIKLNDELTSKKKIDPEIYCIIADYKLTDNPINVYDINNKEGIEITSINYFKSMFGSYIELSYNAGMNAFSEQSMGEIITNRKQLLTCPDEIQSLKDLGLEILDQETKDKLSKRGKDILEILKNPYHCNYTGKILIPGLLGLNSKNISEQVIIDAKACSLIRNSNLINNKHVQHAITLPKLNPEQYWLVSPLLLGFSLKTKQWGILNYENISKINYNKNAFDNLVVPQKYKDVFLACLKNDLPSFDSIEGKGNGKIFLLNGGPGCGKTLTAESISDYLKLPLYNITVGELGITPQAVERSLDNINQLVLRWNAVVLLDEVDVFATKRDSISIEKNALTAVFLRFLEKFNGVIFMTTNLQNNIDKAFVSRATITLNYPNLKKEDKREIWKSILNKIKQEGIKISDEIYNCIDNESKYSVLLNALNGRDLKNFNRICFAMAKENKEVLTKQIINDVIEIYHL